MELRPEIVSELWHSDLIESEDCGLEESQEFYRQVKEQGPPAGCLADRGYRPVYPSEGRGPVARGAPAAPAV